MFDAYTVKKVLPRLVIAVVLIQLSWFIFTGMISLTTAVAYGVEGLIYAPFGGGEALQLDVILRNTPGGVGIFTLMAVAGGLGILGIALSLAGTALLGLLMAFALLMFRQVLIVALLVVSPLALVAWILPNTEKFWKLWWESFSKLLIVYPLILGVIAIGRVFAYITAGVEPGSASDNLFTDLGVETIIKISFIIICFFGPFFFIPKLFAIAGSAFGFVAGMANDKSRGAFDRLKKGRQEKRSKDFHDFTGGSKFSQRNAVTRRLNSIGAGVGAGFKGGYGFGERGRQATALDAAGRAEETLKSNPRLKELAYNDDANALLALSGGSMAGAEQAATDLGFSDARRERALAAIRTVGVNKQNAQAALTTLAQNKSRAVGAGNMGAVQAGINRLAGGNAQAAEDMTGSFQYHSRNAGRFDLGDNTATGGWQRGSLYGLSNGHPSSIQGVGQEMVARAQAGALTGNQAALHQATVFRQELAAMLPNATGETRTAIVDQMAALDATGLGAWSQSASGNIDPATGAQVEVQQRVSYDPTVHAVAGYAGPTWSADDVNRGWRIERRAETHADVAGTEARTYQRPEEENR